VARVANVSMAHWMHAQQGGGNGRGQLRQPGVSRDLALEMPITTGLDDQQAMLHSASLRLLADRYDFDHRRSVIADAGSFDVGLWQAIVDLGLTGLLVPERDGGLGGTFGGAVATRPG